MRRVLRVLAWLVLAVTLAGVIGSMPAWQSVLVEQWRYACSLDREGAWVCADGISYLMPGAIVAMMHLGAITAAALTLFVGGRRPITVVTACTALLLPLAWVSLHGPQPLATPHLLTMLLLGASAAITLVGGLSARPHWVRLLAIAAIVAVVPAAFAPELLSVVVLQVGLTVTAALAHGWSRPADGRTSRVS